MTPAERQRLARLWAKLEGREDTTQRGKTGHRAASLARVGRWRPGGRPFVGVDGEGIGRDAFGRQAYCLFRIGERELFTGKRLKTFDLFEFILSEPKDSVMVAFGLGYDVTMALRDLAADRRSHLLAKRPAGEGRSAYTWVDRRYAIWYRPDKFFRVARIETIDTPEGGKRTQLVKGSARTVYEVRDLFKSSFVGALADFGIVGGDDLAALARMKAARPDQTAITPEVRAYCAEEVRQLAALMEEVRRLLHAEDIRPAEWTGIGRVAEAMLRREGTLNAKALAGLVAPEVQAKALEAYMAGRMEITRVGEVARAIWAYDIGSAFASAMVGLPCLAHGRWEALSDAGRADGALLYVADATFRGPRVARADQAGLLGALPMRAPAGHLYWPLAGGGVYWSTEIEAARRIGWRVEVGEGFAFRPGCDCRTFSWIPEMYERRITLAAAGETGAAQLVKGGLQACYGKFAAIRFGGAYANPIWAGLITARVRSRLLVEAVAQAPGDLVMVATDAVYSLRPLALDVGGGLGQWRERAIPEGLFLVAPGFYWRPGAARAADARGSRGLAAGRFFEGQAADGSYWTDVFEAVWRAWINAHEKGVRLSIPAVEVPNPGFVGLRLAEHRRKPQSAGCWVTDPYDLSFSWKGKRSSPRREGGAMVTAPKIGDRSLVSVSYAAAADAMAALEAKRLVRAEQPDYVDEAPPWPREGEGVGEG
jgi:hypothetical protein